MYEHLLSRRRGLAVFSTVAMILSGCDSAGPSRSFTPESPAGDAGARPTYREDGVVLSKTAAHELADFVAAVQFDAVLPMSRRIWALEPGVRQDALKQLKSAERRVEVALRRITLAGDGVSEHLVRDLDAANRQVDRIMKRFLADDEAERVRARAEALVERYPFLQNQSPEEIQEVLWRAIGIAGKDSTTPLSWLPHSVSGDTGQGDTCNVDCAISAALAFGAAELSFIGATIGCAATTVGIVGCMTFAFGIKFYQIGRLTWGLYTCTKSCT